MKNDQSVEFRIQGLTVRADSRADEPRLRDVDIAVRAGLAQPRDVRRIIKTAIKSGLLNDSDIRALSAQNAGERGRPGTEYWLSETGAMLVLTQMRTPAAIGFTRTVVEVCREAMRQMGESARAYRVETEVIHTPRIGEHPEKREMMSELCKAVVTVQRCSVAAVHGAIRSRYGVNSVYRISVVCWEMLRKELLRANAREVPLLPAPKRTPPAREASSKQPALFAN